MLACQKGGFIEKQEMPFCELVENTVAHTTTSTYCEHAHALCPVPHIREAFFFGSRQLKVAEMDGRAGAQKQNKT